MLLQVDRGRLPFPDVARTVELLGCDVEPAVRTALTTTDIVPGGP
ncbi:hypothetical protein [Pilimelia columellifera]